MTHPFDQHWLRVKAATLRAWALHDSGSQPFASRQTHLPEREPQVSRTA